VAFGLPVKGIDKSMILASLEAFLCKLVTENKRALLVVDEAQNLTIPAIEELRMLSNFQLGEQALLQSFLIGQPELREMMQGAQMQQLRQRVIASYHLGPLDKAETSGYIEHRLKHVGWNNDPSFDPACFDLIYTLTGGLPRRINTLCNRLLLSAYLAKCHSLAPTDVDAVAKEMREEMGPETALSSVAMVEGPSSDQPLTTRMDPTTLHVHFDHIEERIDRLEKTVAAAVDLLHRLLHPERVGKSGSPGAR
jgi:general secretion pathway protein A